MISIYIVPAAFIGLGIWMAMILLSNLGLGVRGRRVAFVILSTALLTPVLIPAGTIMTAYAPNGLLLLAGSPPLLHQPRLVNMALIAFSATAAISWLVARFLVNTKKKDYKAANLGRLFKGIIFPLLTVSILVSVFYGLIPDRQIPVHIDKKLVESEYGTLMDSVAATLEIEGLDQIKSERNRLAQLFDEIPVVLRVSFRDRRLDQSQHSSSSLFFREQKKKFNGTSCSSTGERYRNDRLMRCTRDGGLFGDQETLMYRREAWVGEVNNRIEIEFDYQLFLKLHPAENAKSK